MLGSFGGEIYLLLHLVWVDLSSFFCLLICCLSLYNLILSSLSNTSDIICEQRRKGKYEIALSFSVLPSSSLSFFSLKKINFSNNNQKGHYSKLGCDFLSYFIFQWVLVVSQWNPMNCCHEYIFLFSGEQCSAPVSKQCVSYLLCYSFKCAFLLVLSSLLSYS